MHAISMYLPMYLLMYPPCISPRITDHCPAGTALLALPALQVLKYVPALVVAAACLLGPIIGEHRPTFSLHAIFHLSHLSLSLSLHAAMLEGVLLGVEAVPGPWTLLGGVAAVVGSGLIAAQAQRATTTYDLGLHQLRTPATRRAKP